MAPAESRKKVVKKASKMQTPMTQLDCVPKPEELAMSDCDSLVLKESWGTNLDVQMQDWVFELFKENMYEMYKMSQWGYSPDSKKTELFSTTSRFIIGTTAEKGERIGYVHYRFDLDHDVPVLYCYEIQVTERCQQRGIGSIFLGILEKMAKKAGMSKVLATVFTYNAKSLGFFHKNGYSTDESCPTEQQGLDYLILSKAI